MADIANSMLNSFVFCKNMKMQSLQEEYPNSEIFLALISRIRAACRDLHCKFPYSVWIWEIRTCKNSELGHFLQGEWQIVCWNENIFVITSEQNTVKHRANIEKTR